MNYEEYRFAETAKDKKSKYIYQYIKSRTLTKVPHSHDFYEICYVLRGSCTENHNGRKMLISENTLSISLPGSYHYFTEQTDDLILICLSVEYEEFGKIAATMDDDLSAYLARTSYEQIYRVFGQVSGSIYKNPYLQSQSDLDYKYLLSFFIMNICKNKFHDNVGTPSDFASVVSKLPTTEIIIHGVPKLAELSNYSRTHLNRLMKEHFGKTAWEYVTELRMNYAYNRLIFTDMAIEDIAEKCGFETSSHFSQSFKRRFGITPSAARKMHFNRTI